MIAVFTLVRIGISFYSAAGARSVLRKSNRAEHFAAAVEILIQHEIARLHFAIRAIACSAVIFIGNPKIILRVRFKLCDLIGVRDLGLRI